MAPHSDGPTQGQLADHGQPLPQGGQGQVGKQTIEHNNTRNPLLNRVEMAGNGGSSSQLDQCFTQVEGVVMATADIPGIVGAATDLGQRQRQVDQVLAPDDQGPRRHPAYGMET